MSEHHVTMLFNAQELEALNRIADRSPGKTVVVTDVRLDPDSSEERCKLVQVGHTFFRVDSDGTIWDKFHPRTLRVWGEPIYSRSQYVDER